MSGKKKKPKDRRGVPAPAPPRRDEPKATRHQGPPPGKGKAAAGAKAPRIATKAPPPPPRHRRDARRIDVRPRRMTVPTVPAAPSTSRSLEEIPPPAASAEALPVEMATDEWAAFSRSAITDAPTEPVLPHAGDDGEDALPDGLPSDVAHRIRALEARLDRMIDEASRRAPSAPTSRRGRATPVPPSTLPLSARALPDDGDPTVFETARELLSTDFYLRKWGRLGMRNRSEEVDDFGFDPVYEQKVLPVFNFLYERYFRVTAEGVGNIPRGRCLLVANHSGTVPYDGPMMKLAVKREHPERRDVRWLAEDFVFHFPFLGSFTNRVGAVRACQENAERLLRQEALVAVFPEGVKGTGKLFKDRYRLQRFGRGGFVKLALRTGTPMVPVAIVGGEEVNPMIGRVEYLTKALGLPYVPITPTFPFLGPAGLLPAPSKWRMLFGEPLRWDHYGPDAADDEILVGRLAEQVRATIQATLDRALGERRSVWFG